MIYGREVTLSTVDRDLSNVWWIETAHVRAQVVLKLESVKTVQLTTTPMCLSKMIEFIVGYLLHSKEGHETQILGKAQTAMSGRVSPTLT